MKATRVVLLSAITSVVTLGAFELLRENRAGPPTRASPGTSRARRTSVPETVGTSLDAANSEPDGARVDPEDLVELARRIEALERRLAASERSTVRAPLEQRRKADSDLREIVLEWVAEERAQRQREGAEQAHEAERRQLEFEAEMQALMLAKEHGLQVWEERQLVELFLEIETRRLEIEQSLEPGLDDPREVERRFEEFDLWADRRYRERLDPELFERLFGDEERSG